jgi:hypothetical protein
VITSAALARSLSISCVAASSELAQVAQAWLIVGPPTPAAPIRPVSHGRP